MIKKTRILKYQHMETDLSYGYHEEAVHIIIEKERKEVQKELLEKVRKDFKNVALINVDKYIDNELELINK